ncbi:MAG: hypothetical protein WD342_09240 [Verrucomicrobiales bacterium]
MNGEKSTSWLIRLSGLALVAAAGAWLVGAPLQKKRTELRLRTMLLEVQEALQNYHVAEELYPKRMMSGGELVEQLVESGFLDEGILNPWTRKPYLESTEEDWLRYRTDSLAETYELIVLHPDSEDVQFRLDSTDNQSLEE